MVIESRTVTFDLAGNVIGDDVNEAWADEFLRALGYLLVQSNMLEDALQDLYRIVTDKTWDQIHEDVRGMTLGALRTFVLKEFEQRFPSGEHRDRLEQLRPDLEQAVGARNQFVHASWSFNYGTEQMHRRRLPREKGSVEELRRMTVSDVEAAIESIGDVAQRVWEELYDPIEIASRP